MSAPKTKNFEQLFYSGLGLVAMFVLLMAFYIVVSALKISVDVTADRAHTLSEGTRKILAKIGSRVTVRFYCTQGDNDMPPALRTYAQHVEDLLNEYKQSAHGKIRLIKLDPKPDSDAENSARLNGVEGHATGPYGGNKIYLGLVVSIFDEKFVLPWLPPERDRFLEYDISRAIARVADASPPVVGIMSALPVFGIPSDPLTRDRDDPGHEAWAFVTELKKDFTVAPVPMTVSNIDAAIKVLIVEHPRNISDQTQLALDQFVLRGGKLIAFLDPHAFFDQSHDQQGQTFQVMGAGAYGQSSLSKLLPAWGLNLDVNKVAADTSFGTRNPKNGEMRPTILVVTRAGIDRADLAIGQIDNLLLPFPGVFTGQPAAGLKESVLVHCTTNSQLVDSLITTSASEQILRDFKPSGQEYPLAVRLTGTFHTAFPGLGALAQSTGYPEVILVADTDMLNDRVCLQSQNVMGHRVTRPANGNLNFLQSLVEQLSGDENLITSRSRASMSRPFTRVKDMEARAGRQWEEKIQLLEKQQRETERNISELQMHKEGSDEQKDILSSEQETALAKYQEKQEQTTADLKAVRNNLRKDTDALEFWIKVINIAAMPVLVAVSGLAVALVNHNRRRAAKR